MRDQQRHAQTAAVEEVEVGATGAQVDHSSIDELLEEIDGVLEENAEAFVQGFVQKGGE